MTKEEFGDHFMGIAGVANPHHLRKAMRLPDTHSGYVQAQKILRGLSELGKIDRRNRLYFSKNSKSEGGEHALAVADHIAEIFARFDGPQVLREHQITGKGLRPDLICHIRRGNHELCFILEVVRNETPEYLAMKRSVWAEWPEASEYLSNLFKTTVRHFDFVTSEEFNLYLEGVCAGFSACSS